MWHDEAGDVTVPDRLHDISAAESIMFQTQDRLHLTVIHAGPEIRTIAIAALPGAVESAKIVGSSLGVENCLTEHLDLITDDADILRSLLRKIERVWIGLRLVGLIDVIRSRKANCSGYPCDTFLILSIERPARPLTDNGVKKSLHSVRRQGED